MSRKKVTVLSLQQKKESSQPITMLTAYDYASAVLVDKAEIDTILVGDSLGMVMLGYDGTVPVTMEEMLHHCRAVARGAKYALLIGDMPFMSYQTGRSTAVANAGRFLKEAHMEAVKLEGGVEVVDTVQAVVRAGIPVMGHIGLTPQSVSKLGGYRVQGKTAEAAVQLLADAIALQDAGCFSIVLEAVPEAVARSISQKLRIPTIGIGAGVGCDGQVLVYHDILGMFDRLKPRFVKQYANLGQTIVEALSAYREDVHARAFPASEYTYEMPQEELEAFMGELER
jgi:3-methyl-2-oxobutanoate hydroxymethyltransferase